ncbi:MAG: DUF2240 family protein [Methanotrichaceae archaeon]|jgi:hypothetical protein
MATNHAAWDEMIQGLPEKLKVDAGAVYEPEIFKIIEEIYYNDQHRWENIKTIINKFRISVRALTNKFKSESQDDEEVFETPFVDFGEGKLAEMVLQNVTAKFAVYDPSTNKIEYVPELRANGIRIIPPIDDEIFKKGYVTLPSMAEDYGNEMTLYNEIKTFTHKYLEVSEDYESISGFYPMLTWVYDVMSVIAYLRAKGDWGVGKSRFLDVFKALCYRSVATTGAMSEAPIFRIMDKWKGTMIMDEGDLGKSKDSRAAMEKILVCGFERGKPIIRCNPNKPEEVNVFDPFGAKIIATRFEFRDKALESRCLSEIMKEGLRTDVPIELPPEFYTDALHLRNKLLMYRFKNRAKIKARSERDEIPIDLTGIPKRLRQVARPISVVIADHPDLLDTLKSFMEGKAKMMVAEAAETTEGHLVHVLANNANYTSEDSTRYQWDLTYTDLLEAVKTESGNYKLTLNIIKSRGNSLGFKTERVGKERQRLITCDVPLFENLKRRYVRTDLETTEESVRQESTPAKGGADVADGADAKEGAGNKICAQNDHPSGKPSEGAIDLHSTQILQWGGESASAPSACLVTPSTDGDFRRTDSDQIFNNDHRCTEIICTGCQRIIPKDGLEDIDGLPYCHTCAQVELDRQNAELRRELEMDKQSNNSVATTIEQTKLAIEQTQQDGVPSKDFIHMVKLPFQNHNRTTLEITDFIFFLSLDVKRGYPEQIRKVLKVAEACQLVQTHPIGAIDPKSVELLVPLGGDGLV